MNEMTVDDLIELDALAQVYGEDGVILGLAKLRQAEAEKLKMEAMVAHDGEKFRLAEVEDGCAALLQALAEEFAGVKKGLREVAEGKVVDAQEVRRAANG